jgi:hypothetical protein
VGGESFFFTCPGCAQRVDPDTPSVVYAVERVHLGQRSNDVIDGIPAFFHLPCFERAGGTWQRRDRPEGI